MTEMTMTTYRVVWYDPEDIWEDVSKDFNTVQEALKYAETTTESGHAIVERVEVTPVYALRNVLKTTPIK